MRRLGFTVLLDNVQLFVITPKGSCAGVWPEGTPVSEVLDRVVKHMRLDESDYLEVYADEGRHHVDLTTPVEHLRDGGRTVLDVIATGGSV